MEILIQNFRKKIARTSLDFIRSTEFEINWNARLICIRGPRGVGKTTLMLQHIKKEFSENMQQVMYVSLDNLYFTDNSLIDFVRHFVQRGGTHLFLDEVHKYPHWSQTIKNIYDINLTNKSTPIENRKAKEFSYYYDLIWKDIDHYE